MDDLAARPHSGAWYSWLFWCFVSWFTSNGKGRCFTGGYCSPMFKNFQIQFIYIVTGSWQSLIHTIFTVQYICICLITLSIYVHTLACAEGDSPIPMTFMASMARHYLLQELVLTQDAIEGGSSTGDWLPPAWCSGSKIRLFFAFLSRQVSRAVGRLRAILCKCALNIYHFFDFQSPEMTLAFTEWQHDPVCTPEA